MADPDCKCADCKHNSGHSGAKSKEQSDQCCSSTGPAAPRGPKAAAKTGNSSTTPSGGEHSDKPTGRDQHQHEHPHQHQQGQKQPEDNKYEFADAAALGEQPAKKARRESEGPRAGASHGQQVNLKQVPAKKATQHSPEKPMASLKAGPGGEVKANKQHDGAGQRAEAGQGQQHEKPKPEGGHVESALGKRSDQLDTGKSPEGSKDNANKKAQPDGAQADAASQSAIRSQPAQPGQALDKCTHCCPKHCKPVAGEQQQQQHTGGQQPEEAEAEDANESLSRSQPRSRSRRRQRRPRARAGRGARGGRRRSSRGRHQAEASSSLDFDQSQSDFESEARYSRGPARRGQGRRGGRGGGVARRRSRQQ